MHAHPTPPPKKRCLKIFVNAADKEDRVKFKGTMAKWLVQQTNTVSSTIKNIVRAGTHGKILQMWIFVISKEHSVSGGGGVSGSRVNVRDPYPFWRGNTILRNKYS